MNYDEIDMGETHIRLTTDIANHNLKRFIYYLRMELKDYIRRNPDFSLSLEGIDSDHAAPDIAKLMIESSGFADVGPMACVAGAISELSLKYLIRKRTSYSIVENGGDIALVNDKKVLCGIYSNNNVLGNNIGFQIRPQRKMLGICTSSGKIGHSISFGEADSVTVVSKSPAVSDALATRIANEVTGGDSESRVNNALLCADDYKEFFYGVLIICEGHVATVGRLPKIVETNGFNVRM